jgi:hypothetical protein
MRGGVYVYRTRKPGARLNLPIISRHFGYVGETSSFWHRHAQHSETQPWADLDPRCYRIGLPAWKPLLRTVETLVILCTWPVYNHAKNQWNPRRIPLGMARRMRAARDRGQWYPSVRLIHVLTVLLLVLAAAYYFGGR